MADEPPRRRRREEGGGGGGARRDQRPASRKRRAPAREPRRRPRSDLLSRALVGIPAAVIAIIFVRLGGTAFAGLMIVLGWVCLDELYKMLERWRPVSVAGFLVLAGLVIAARFGSQVQVLLAFAAAVPIVFLLVLMRGERVNATVSIAGTLLGIYWIGLGFAHAELLRQLPHGGGIVIDVLVGTFLGDTAAYLGGRAFGRRPLAPAISPHKTVEGLFCGMLIAFVSVLVAGIFQQWLTTQHALMLGLGVAVAAPVGDLFESLIKRDAGTKDTGSFFGAHGGALDRLDAAIFTVVVGYYIWLGLH